MSEQKVLSDMLAQHGVTREWVQKLGEHQDPDYVHRELEREGVTFEELVIMSCWMFVEEGKWEYVGDGQFQVTEEFKNA
jgi:hypothetical protein